MLILEILFLIVVIILLILYIGFSINLHLIKKEKEINGVIEIYWSKIRLINKEIYPKEKKEDKENKEKKSTSNIKKYKPLIKEGKITIKELIKLILKSKDSIHIEKLYIDLILGLNSSVDTSKTMGWFWIIGTPLNLKDNCNVYGECDFSKERLDFTLDLKIKISLLIPLLRLIKLLLKKPTIKLIKDFIKIKRSKNEN